MNARNDPVSPVSVGGGGGRSSGEWPYQQQDSNPPPPPYHAQDTTPPDSAVSFGTMNGGFPPGPPPMLPGPRSVGGPSPPPSIGRSSTGTLQYARSEAGPAKPLMEDDVRLYADHYRLLKVFLDEERAGGALKQSKPKARDKLQRLSASQFSELSTDVYDEVDRRRAAKAEPLPYENNFHPKRNQAREKLASLARSRFADLAGDVYAELERRLRAKGSPVVLPDRNPLSRSQTPVNGMMPAPPPRLDSRRRPSEASSVRSGRGVMPPTGQYGGPVQPSPAIQNGDYRPIQKQFQSNTIVANKSTMVEEDDDAASPPADPRRGAADRYGPTRRSADRGSENDKKLIEEYESQVRDLREKLDGMEDAMKKKEDEMNATLENERFKSTAASAEKQGWDETRAGLERKVADVQQLNDSLQRALDRIRKEHGREVQMLKEDHERAMRLLRDQIDRLGTSTTADPDLERENQELRGVLREQQQVTEEVRREAQEYLREMRLLSQQSGSAWAKQTELERTIEALEAEARDWRDRYARTKAQLRNMRAASMGISAEEDASKYVREMGFIRDNGLVKDVHVTKFQMSVNELLQRARTESPEKVIDSMKAVVVSVRRITKDIDALGVRDDDTVQQLGKLKVRVSSTANSLITASKTFSSSAGMSPVSILDAAASNLVTAVVELLRVAKIRQTPADELKDDDGDNETPRGSASVFSPGSNGKSQSQSTAPPGQESLPVPSLDNLPRPPPFRGLSRDRTSIDSSEYSMNSPRESVANGRSMARGGPGGNMANGIDSAMNDMRIGGEPRGFGDRVPTPPRKAQDLADELSNRVNDPTNGLVPTIQTLVSLIREDIEFDASLNNGSTLVNALTSEIEAVAQITNDIVYKVQSRAGSSEPLDQMRDELDDLCKRLLEAKEVGLDLANRGPNPSEWRVWKQTLPPIAFKIARDTKTLVQQVEDLSNRGADDFA